MVFWLMPDPCSPQHYPVASSNPIVWCAETRSLLSVISCAEELKKRGAVFSHADTIDAPWAVRSGVCAPQLPATMLG